ncbi:MAG: GAF domain-containing protein [Actinomycetes bacterium]
MSTDQSLTRLLSSLTDQLGVGATGGSATDVVVPALREAFAAAVVTVAAFEPPSTLRLVGVVGLEHRPQTREEWSEFDVSAAVPMAEAARTGQAVWVENIEHERARFRAWSADTPSRSACALPMRSGGALVGVLGLSWNEPRVFTAAEQDTLTTLAGITATAIVVDRHKQVRRLGVVDSTTLADDVHLAYLVRDTATAVPRTLGLAGAVGVTTLSWLIEAPADPALAVACEGVLALARRRGTPPGMAARNVADVVDELHGSASGVIVQVGPQADWLAVAGVNDVLILTAPMTTTAPVAAFSAAATAADEHVIVPDGDGATVLALLVPPRLHVDVAARLLEVAQTEFDRRRGASAEDLLGRVAERLGEHGMDSSLLGAIALAVAPRHEQRVLRRRLPARLVAVPLARRFAVAALADAPDEVTFAAGLVVNELVSNAVRHSDHSFDIAVVVTDESVHIEVSDDDDRLPEVMSADQDPDELLESGRGLTLLAGVAEDWGTESKATGGKTTWAKVRRR